jgi:hypothetical protein
MKNLKYKFMKIFTKFLVILPPSALDKLSNLSKKNNSNNFKN